VYYYVETRSSQTVVHKTFQIDASMHIINFENNYINFDRNAFFSSNYCQLREECNMYNIGIVI